MRARGRAVERLLAADELQERVLAHVFGVGCRAQVGVAHAQDEVGVVAHEPLGAAVGRTGSMRHLPHLLFGSSRSSRGDFRNFPFAYYTRGEGKCDGISPVSSAESPAPYRAATLVQCTLRPTEGGRAPWSPRPPSPKKWPNRRSASATRATASSSPSCRSSFSGKSPDDRQPGRTCHRILALCCLGLTDCQPSLVAPGPPSRFHGRAPMRRGLAID